MMFIPLLVAFEGLRPHALLAAACSRRWFDHRLVHRVEVRSLTLVYSAFRFDVMSPTCRLGILLVSVRVLLKLSARCFLRWSRFALAAASECLLASAV